MVIFIVFVVVIAAIGLAVYGGSMVHDPITYIAEPECELCGHSLYDSLECEACGIPPLPRSNDDFDHGQQGGEPNECHNPSANVICLRCLGLLELNCGCPLMQMGRGAQWCKCKHPQRSNDLDDL